MSQPPLPSDLIPRFRDLLLQYDTVRAALYAAVEPHLTVRANQPESPSAPPCTPIILHQITHWPDGQFIYPPVAWIVPRAGQLVFQGIPWSYSFHGGGLTFVQPTTGLDVSIEFARTGEAALTEWTIRCYLTTMDAPASAVAAILTHLERLVADAVVHQILYPVPPLLEGDDQTYVVWPGARPICM